MGRGRDELEFRSWILVAWMWLLSLLLFGHFYCDHTHATPVDAAPQPEAVLDWPLEWDEGRHAHPRWRCPDCGNLFSEPDDG